MESWPRSDGKVDPSRRPTTAVVPRLPRFPSLALFGTVLAVVAALARALRRAAAGAAEVPLSPLTAGWRVGADYLDRRGLRGEGEVAGEMDDLSAFGRPGFHPDSVAPAVRAFYERTADYELAYEVYWHRPFRVGAVLAGRATSRLEQLNLPGPGESGVGRLDSRFEPVAPGADPRADARAWVRTREDGTAVFVAIYAHHERDGVRYVNIGVPLPRGNLSTILRPGNLADGGLELTTLNGDPTADPDSDADAVADSDSDANADEGLSLVTPVGAFELPLDQRFRVWPVDASCRDVSADAFDDRASVVASHEMWLLGRQFLTIRYAGWPRR
jgi:hypothetical protein